MKYHTETATRFDHLPDSLLVIEYVHLPTPHPPSADHMIFKRPLLHYVCLTLKWNTEIFFWVSLSQDKFAIKTVEMDYYYAYYHTYRPKKYDFLAT